LVLVLKRNINSKAFKNRISGLRKEAKLIGRPDKKAFLGHIHSKENTEASKCLKCLKKEFVWLTHFRLLWNQCSMAGSMNTYFARFQRRRLRSSWLYKIKVASSSGGPGEPHTFGESLGESGERRGCRRDDVWHFDFDSFRQLSSDRTTGKPANWR